MSRPLPQVSKTPSDPSVTGCGDERCAEVCTLNRLGIGQCGTVVSVAGQADLRRRLLEMGLCGGTRVEVVRRSPFGDPIELRLRGYCLSLRDEQAKHVTVEAVDSER
ncbi:MAG: FeoA family protein [Tepidisphaeraceae bacterium]